MPLRSFASKLNAQKQDYVSANDLILTKASNAFVGNVMERIISHENSFEEGDFENMLMHVENLDTMKQQFVDCVKGLLVSTNDRDDPDNEAGMLGREDLKENPYFTRAFVIGGLIDKLKEGVESLYDAKVQEEGYKNLLVELNDQLDTLYYRARQAEERGESDLALEHEIESFESQKEYYQKNMEGVVIDAVEMAESNIDQCRSDLYHNVSSYAGIAGHEMESSKFITAVKSINTRLFADNNALLAITDDAIQANQDLLKNDVGETMMKIGSLFEDLQRSKQGNYRMPVGEGDRSFRSLIDFAEKAGTDLLLSIVRVQEENEYDFERKFRLASSDKFGKYFAVANALEEIKKIADKPNLTLGDVAERMDEAMRLVFSGKDADPILNDMEFYRRKSGMLNMPGIVRKAAESSFAERDQKEEMQKKFYNAPGDADLAEDIGSLAISYIGDINTFSKKMLEALSSRDKEGHEISAYAGQLESAIDRADKMVKGISLGVSKLRNKLDQDVYQSFARSVDQMQSLINDASNEFKKNVSSMKMDGVVDSLISGRGIGGRNDYLAIAEQGLLRINSAMKEQAPQITSDMLEHVAYSLMQVRQIEQGVQSEISRPVKPMVLNKTIEDLDMDLETALQTNDAYWNAREATIQTMRQAIGDTDAIKQELRQEIENGFGEMAEYYESTPKIENYIRSLLDGVDENDTIPKDVTHMYDLMAMFKMKEVKDQDIQYDPKLKKKEMQILADINGYLAASQAEQFGITRPVDVMENLDKNFRKSVLDIIPSLAKEKTPEEWKGEEGVTRAVMNDVFGAYSQKKYPYFDNTYKQYQKAGMSAVLDSPFSPTKLLLLGDYGGIKDKIFPKQGGPHNKTAERAELLFKQIDGIYKSQKDADLKKDVTSVLNNLKTFRGAVGHDVGVYSGVVLRLGMLKSKDEKVKKTMEGVRSAINDIETLGMELDADIAALNSVVSGKNKVKEEVVRKIIEDIDQKVENMNILVETLQSAVQKPCIEIQKKGRIIAAVIAIFSAAIGIIGAVLSGVKFGQNVESHVVSANQPDITKTLDSTSAVDGINTDPSNPDLTLDMGHMPTFDNHFTPGYNQHGFQININADVPGAAPEWVNVQDATHITVGDWMNAIEHPETAIRGVDFSGHTFNWAQMHNRSDFHSAVDYIQGQLNYLKSDEANIISHLEKIDEWMNKYDVGDLDVDATYKNIMQNMSIADIQTGGGEVDVLGNYVHAVDAARGMQDIENKAHLLNDAQKGLFQNPVLKGEPHLDTVKYDDYSSKQTNAPLIAGATLMGVGGVGAVLGAAMFGKQASSLRSSVQRTNDKRPELKSLGDLKAENDWMDTRSNPSSLKSVDPGISLEGNRGSHSGGKRSDFEDSEDRFSNQKRSSSGRRGYDGSDWLSSDYSHQVNTSPARSDASDISSMTEREMKRRGSNDRSLEENMSPKRVFRSASERLGEQRKKERYSSGLKSI